MEASGLTAVGVILGEEELDQLCGVKSGKIQHSYLDQEQLIKQGLDKSFLNNPELRKMAINRKNGSLVIGEGETPFLIDVEGVVLAIVTITSSSDNLTMVAVICDSTIRYFFIKCGSTFAFFTRDPQLCKLLKMEDFDPLTLIGLDLLKANIQKGKRVHDSTTKLAFDFWRRIIWSSGVNNYTKTNFAIKRGGKVINANIYLDKVSPTNDIISLNGRCTHYELGIYPTNDVMAACTKKTKKAKPVGVHAVKPNKDEKPKPITQLPKDNTPSLVKKPVLDNGVPRGNVMILVSGRK